MEGVPFQLLLQIMQELIWYIYINVEKQVIAF